MNPSDISVSQSAPSSSHSLLNRVKARDAQAWLRLSNIYSPLVYRWARQAGLQQSDAADVVQETFRSVVASIDKFQHDSSSGSFRGWLWTIARNKIHDHFRSLAQRPEAVGGSAAQLKLDELPDQLPSEQSDSGLSELGGVGRRALELVRDQFDARVWLAFWRLAVEGDAAADVAADLGVSVWAVYKAKSRVLVRLRRELEDVLD